MSGSRALLGSPLGEVGWDLARRHLQQLRSRHSLLGARLPASGPPEGTLAQLIEWSQINQQHIANAVAKGAFSNGVKSVDWEIVFLAFMESAATYLRDEVKLAKAVETFSKAHSTDLAASDNQEALQLYFDSTADIRTLAKLWGLDFVMICDLPDNNQSGNIFIGPYCGCFFSPGTNKKPFMSVAFKGTDFSAIGEGIVDFVYDTFKAPKDMLFGTNVSIGVYDSLFSRFEIGPTTASPFQLIHNTLLAVTASMQPVKSPDPIVPILHVTGHSLGASYACFCFAQLLAQTGTPTHDSGQLGDLYTFGCPRLGYSDWSEALFDAMAAHTGTSVRVVNQEDLVPQVVPIIFRDWAPFYNHVDAGWNVFPDQPPTEIPTERGTSPPALDSVWNWSTDVADHQTVSYYASLVHALGLQL